MEQTTLQHKLCESAAFSYQTLHMQTHTHILTNIRHKPFFLFPFHLHMMQNNFDLFRQSMYVMFCYLTCTSLCVLCTLFYCLFVCDYRYRTLAIYESKQNHVNCKQRKYFTCAGWCTARIFTLPNYLLGISCLCTRGTIDTNRTRI